MKRITALFKGRKKKLSLMVRDWKVIDGQLLVTNRDGVEVLYPGKVREVCEKCEVE